MLVSGPTQPSRGPSMTNQVATLTFDIDVADGVPVVTSDLPPGQKQRLWSPISATLISAVKP